MGRLDKLKREMITEANRKLLNEIVDISIAEPEMDNTTVSMGSNEGLLLECVKIDELNPKNSEFSYAGPYPWDLVEYSKEIDIDNKEEFLFYEEEGNFNILKEVGFSNLIGE